MARIIRFEGRQITVPDDATDDEIAQILGGAPAAPAVQAPAVTAEVPAQPMSPVGLSDGPGLEAPMNVTPATSQARMRSGKIALQAAGGGLAEAAALPFDIPTLAKQGVEWLVDKGLTAAGAPAKPAGVPEMPLLSDLIKSGATKVAQGLGYEPVTPETGSEKFLDNVVRFGTQGGATGAVLAKAAAARAPALLEPGATPVRSDRFLRPYFDAPKTAIAADTSAGAGAGAVLTASQSLPDPVRDTMWGGTGVLADLMAMLAGGLGGATATQILAGAPTTASRAIRNMGDAQLPVDPETALPATNKAADVAAKFYQGQSIDPTKAAATVGNNVAQFTADGLPVPTTGLISGDTGLAALERAQRQKFSTGTVTPSAAPDVKSQYSFGERDTALRDKAVSDLQTLRPAGVTPDDYALPRTEAERLIAERLAQAEQTGRSAIASAEDTGRQTVRAAEEAARRQLAEVEAAIAAREAEAQAQRAAAQQQATAAEQAARDQGAAVLPMRSETYSANASRRLHDAVVEPYREARTAKNQAFDSIDPNRTTQVDAGPVIAAAARVRQNVNDLGPERLQLPAEFVQRLERLAPNMQRVESAVLGPDGRPLALDVNVGGPGQAALGDLVDVRKYLSTAYENARQAGNFDLADNIAELRRAINATINAAPDAVGANQVYQQFAGTYRPNPTDAFAKFSREIDRGKDPAPTRTAGRFLSGPEQTEALRRVLNAAPTRDIGEQAVRDFQIGEAASVALNKNDTLNWRALAKWRDANAEALRVFPNPEVDRLIATAQRGEQVSSAAITRLREAEANFANVRRQGAQEIRTTSTAASRSVRAAEQQATAGTRAAEREATRLARQTEAEVNASALSSLAGRSPENAVKAVMGSGDPVGAVREITATVGKNAKAMDGLRAAFADHLVEKVSSVNPANVSEGVTQVNFARLVKEFNKNQRVLEAIHGPDAMNVLRRVQRVLEPLAQRQGQATVGSITAENSEAAWRALRLMLYAKTGSTLAAGGAVARVKDAVASIVGKNAVADEANRLITRAHFDPELAQMLLTRKVEEIGTPPWNQRLAKILRRTEAAKTLAGENDEN